MLSDGPITPPLSPARSEEGETPIIVDSEPHYSVRGTDVRLSPRNSRHSTRRAREQSPSTETETVMDVDPRPVASSPRPPLRHLEDEQPHVEKGSLKLTDFEVKGTLGRLGLRIYTKVSRLMMSHTRHRNLRQSASSAATD